jgi:hypothetical protein
VIAGSLAITSVAFAQSPPPDAVDASSSPPPSDIVASESAPFDETRRLADEHIRIGVQDFNARLFREALHEFEIAYQISHDPLLLSNIGTARFETGDLTGARDALEEYLRRVPDPPNRDAIQARLDEANRRLAAAAPITPVSSAPPPRDHREVPRADAGIGAVRATGLVIGGVGVITLGLGVGFWTGVDSAYQVCARMPCEASAQPRTLDTVSVAMMWTGAALTAGGLVLFLVGPRPEPSRDRARTRGARVTQLAFDPSHGLAIGGEF